MNFRLSHQHYKVGYDYPHFIDEASEAQTGNKNFPQCHYHRAHCRVQEYGQNLFLNFLYKMWCKLTLKSQTFQSPSLKENNILQYFVNIDRTPKSHSLGTMDASKEMTFLDQGKQTGDCFSKDMFAFLTSHGNSRLSRFWFVNFIEFLL